MRQYFSDINHRSWLNHYVAADYGGISLAFTKQWRNRWLVADSTSNGLNVFLYDRTDGKVYKTKLYASYEKDEQPIVMTRNYEAAAAITLMGYFYGSHHCPCHRKADAKTAGAVVEDDECEGDRFTIYAITCDTIPDLILHSEILTEDLLEERLCQVTRSMW